MQLRMGGFNRFDPVKAGEREESRKKEVRASGVSPWPGDCKMYSACNHNVARPLLLSAAALRALS